MISHASEILVEQVLMILLVLPSANTAMMHLFLE
jgi:hypothetical protein